MFDDLQGAKRKQPAPDASQKGTGLRTTFRYTWILIAIVAVAIAGIFYSRWQENRNIEEKAAQQRQEEARKIVEGMGGSKFAIMSFYASPGLIHRGESAELCYGVSNAKTVSIDPKLPEAVWPSLSRCVSISPAKTTTYTLTAEDSEGKKKTQSLTLEVH